MTPGIQETLKQLFDTQQLAVLATRLCNSPGTYTSLVGFAASPDLRHILFATARGTRKYTNLKAHPEVSLLIDSRANRGQDFLDAAAVTVLGRALEIQDDQRNQALGLFLSRQPQLEAFAANPGTALVRVEVSSYFYVNHFENVVELSMES